jgi:hypothetical protein
MSTQRKCIVLMAVILSAVLLLHCSVSAQYHIYWGDMHGHTNISDGSESIDYYLTYARDTSALDFVIVTDHDFGNGIPSWWMPKSNWDLIQDKVDAYIVNGSFVAIAGYEWTSQRKYWKEYVLGSENLFDGPVKGYNHKNVYFPSRVPNIFCAKDPAYISPNLLAEAVQKTGGLIHNNHPSKDSDPDGKDQWKYDSSYSSVIINTEIESDVISYQGKTYTLNVEQTVRNFLNGGGKTGFVKGTDTHESKPKARTAIFAKELTRQAIFEALLARRNYAVSNARIILDFKINGHYMGEEIKIEGNPKITVDVKGTANIDEVAIIRDGSILYSTNPGETMTNFEYEDSSFTGNSYYYLRVTQVDTDMYGNHSHAWSSPIWVSKISVP